MIRVALVDDQRIMIEGLKMIVGHGDIRVVGSASNGYEAYELCKEKSIDVMLMDIKMPNCNGVEAVKKIKRDYPHIKIIMLTTFNDDAYIFDSLRYGASGYLLKDAEPSEIIEAIKNVNAGGAMIEPTSANRLIEKFIELSLANDQTNEFHDIPLTKREKDVCRLVIEGKNNKEIADELYISEGTVKNNLTNILSKLNLRDRTQLAIYLLQHNVL
ncbi:response regulator transcription factor [Vallitalea okinawensis]|uniref:response regulator transcription factor n=1 Tax=Vallitalea okinawensis TaxID=2078660 RepID=UPI000CFB7319|nr:response regulator transcription factor [Vallitalea okinawensis]